MAFIRRPAHRTQVEERAHRRVEDEPVALAEVLQQQGVVRGTAGGMERAVRVMELSESSTSK